MKLRFDFKAEGWPSNALGFEGPSDIVTAYTLDEVEPVLQAVQDAANRGRWAAGYVAYEAAAAFDSSNITHPAAGTPLVWFGLFEAPVEAPHDSRTPISRLDEWKPAISRSEYDRCVNAIRDAEGRGDLYQANYTFPLNGSVPKDAYSLYCRLQRSSQCRYGAYLETEDLTLLSASPELFFQYSNRDRTITTRPMKGTLSRGRWLEEDREQASLLATSEKDRAENLMIVDLLRNDLGRVAVPGTVRFPKLFEVEQYPTLWQMTSTVTASVLRNVSLADLFRSLFPCGSITGAPKIAAMQKIAELERFPRGVYCGAIGMVRPGGDALFSVAIRTITILPSKNEAIYNVGGGITWDSTASNEYEEALSKSNVLTEDDSQFSLIETLRLENSVYFLRQRHIDRITDSSRYLGRPFNISEFESELSRCANAHPEGDWRVRLLVDEYGAIRSECVPLVLESGKQLFRIAGKPVCSRDRFLFHKTTHRVAYESSAAERDGVYDVLFTNEQGELTEFSRGNLVVAIGGRMLTPLRNCGLLAGTFRQEMLAQGIVTEEVATPDMLRRADQIWFINSVRGWVEMEQKTP